MGGQPVFEHVGDEGAGEADVEEASERGGRRAHGHGSKRLAAAQQLAIDGAKLVEDLADTAVIAQIFDDSRVVGLGHILHRRPLVRAAQRQIILGAMPGALGAFAARFAATLVAFDERASEHRIERR